MRKNLKYTCLLVAATVYCWSGWMLMRHDYYTIGQQSSTTRQFVHLLCTFFILFGIILWNGKAFERLIARLSALPSIQGVAPFLAFAAVMLTMLYYPRSQAVFSGIAWGMMESTRLLVQQLFLAGSVIGIALLALLYLRRPAEALFEILERLLFSSPEKVFVAAAALLIFISVNALSLLHFRHLPVLPEEVVHLFQARIFSSGQLYAQAPALPEFFGFGSIVLTDKWYLPGPPGFPLLLALGFLINAPWLINPALAAACVVLVYACAKRMYNERTARGSILLMVVSPFTLFLSSLYLSHASTAFFLLLSLFFLLKALEESPKAYFLAGLAYGAAVAIAPLIGIAAGIPSAAYLLGLLLKRRLNILPFLSIICGALLIQSVFIFYALATSGRFSAYDFLSGFDSGFVALPFGLPLLQASQIVLKAIANLNNRLHYFSVYLLGWPLPALLFAAIPFASASKNTWDYLLLLSFLSIPAATLFLFQDDALFGPRYYYVVAPAALILVARGMETLPLLWGRLTGRNASHLFLPLLVFCCIIFNVTYFFPARLNFYNISSYAFKLVPSPVQQVIDSARIHNAVVFIDDFPFELAYGAGFWLNHPSLAGDIIYARDLETHNKRLMERYPGRKYYRYSYLANLLEEISPESEHRRPVAFSQD